MGDVLHIEQRIIEAERRWPQLSSLLFRKTADEGAGPCPFCGGEDRFCIFADGGYWCRKCRETGWLDEDRDPPSKEQIQEMRLRALERKVEEQDRRLARLEEMHACRDHLRYHSNLDEHKRTLWYQAGIYDEAIDKFQLGYASECPTWRSSPSLTMPVYDYDNQLANIRHRLLKPDGHGKYRPHRSGLGQQLFNAPTLRDSHERLLVVEGEKKVICLDQAGFPAVGIMGKSVWRREWFGWFDVGRIYIALDPDADESASRLAKVFASHGFGNVWIADFPMKPDDFIYEYGGNLRHVERVLRLARPVVH